MTSDAKIRELKELFMLFSASPADPREVAHGFMRSVAEILRGKSLREIHIPEVPADTRKAFEPRNIRAGSTEKSRRLAFEELTYFFPTDEGEVAAWAQSQILNISYLAKAEQVEAEQYVGGVHATSSELEACLEVLQATRAPHIIVSAVRSYIAAWNKYVKPGDMLWLTPAHFKVIIDITADITKDAQLTPQAKIRQAAALRSEAFQALEVDVPDVDDADSLARWLIEQMLRVQALALAPEREQDIYAPAIHGLHIDILAAISCYRAFPVATSKHRSQRKVIDLILQAYADKWLNEIESMSGYMEWPRKSWFKESKRLVTALARASAVIGIESRVSYSAEESEDQDL